MAAQPRVGKANGGALNLVRNVPLNTRLLLFVRAGGRCQFDGCNRYLLEHHLTGEEGNFAQVAHICAFSERGPRGGEVAPQESVHDISNLMLLCPECHKLVDDRPEEYTIEVLRQHKKSHEARIFTLTETKPDRHTVAVVLMAQIGGQAVSVSLPEIRAAVSPRYVGEGDVVRIDLNAIPEHASRDYWQTAARAIEQKLARLYEQSFAHGPARHISVFALGPIPLLLHLGWCLSDKVPVTLYQRHRDAEDWRWKDGRPEIAYTSRCLRHGTGNDVALLVSLSGRVAESELPNEIDDRVSLYEITLADRDPTPWFLETEACLHAFRSRFQGLLREVLSAHAQIERVHLFPAIPAPMAVAMGRDLMRKRDPTVVIYDYDKRAGGFVPTLEVNKDDS